MKKLWRKIKENKSFLAPFLILLVSVIIFAAGVTYAYFDYAVEKTDISSLRVTGAGFDIVIAGTPINVTGAYPIYDEYKDSEANTYNFTVRNNSGKIGACYKIKLLVSTLSAALRTTDLKWELTNNTNNTVTSGNFYEVSNKDEIMLEEENSINYNTTISYTLKIWLSYSEVNDQSSVQGGILNAKIGAEAQSEVCGKLAVSYFEEWEGPQPFVAPANGTYFVELWGAQGGNNTVSDGAYTAGKIELTKGEKFYVYIGKQSNTANTKVYNGGESDEDGYPGGGATDIRTVGGTWNNPLSLNSRIMVAAGSGAGSGNDSSIKGAGGGLIGYPGGDGVLGGTQNLTPATSFTASLFGIANGGCSGGNGYYPGGSATCTSGSAGGSSYISGHAGSIAIEEGSVTTPTRAIKSGCDATSTSVECSIHYSGYSFTDTVMIDGAGYSWSTERGSQTQMPRTDGTYYPIGTGNTGHGHARITLLDEHEVAVVATNGTVENGYTLTNLVTNGSFDANTTGWTPWTSGDLELKENKGMYNTGFVKFPSSINSYGIYSNSFTIDAGESVYAKAFYKMKDNGDTSIRISDRTSGNLAHLQATTSNTLAYEWKSISVIARNDSATLTTYNLDLYSVGNMYTAWDNIMVIDLEDSFGVGMIPNKTWLDENIPYINGTGGFNSKNVVDEKNVTFTVTPSNGRTYVSHNCYGNFTSSTYSGTTLTVNGVKEDIQCYVNFN